ncbi:MAG: ORF6N domain-containing protein [Verrucomicrobiota bacterium]
MAAKESLVPTERIASMILLVRGERVMMDSDLAELYGVPTKALNQAVKRNADRFPADFMFQLTREEKVEVVAHCDHLKGLRFSPSLPYGFTEHGALMLASVLNSRRAVDVSVFVVRAFVRMREMLASHRELARRLADAERRVKGHDEKIGSLVNAIRQLREPAEVKPKKIGFSRD